MPDRAEPHINDFLNQLYTLRDDAGAKTREDAKAILARNAARGFLHSGATLRALAELVENTFDATLTAMLEALRHASTLPSLDYRDMHDQTFLRARDLIGILRGASNIDKWMGEAGLAAQKAVEAQLSRLPIRLTTRMRNFEVGLDHTAKLREGTVTNNIVNAHTISGIVQQAGAGSALNVAQELNPEQISAAAAELLAEIEKAQDQDSNDICQLTSDVGTIRSQLAAPTPRGAILREAGHSIRNVVEGAVGGTLTPSLLTAAMGLAHLLGH